MGEDHAGVDAVGPVELVLDEPLEPLDQRVMGGQQAPEASALPQRRAWFTGSLAFAIYPAERVE
ncbi:hypothetical protein [Arthrobacter globiformis]|uniref:hypothetical protein n=1 Tax=Arthrobacter globiformis TaxID=1665 RepID=UPI0027922F94|nr:hypothetical protein [Arthrobacter globiformis]MDQ0618670.1 hypothetical protein [Arthrobacter globiformis]